MMICTHFNSNTPNWLTLTFQQTLSKTHEVIVYPRQNGCRFISQSLTMVFYRSGSLL